ncbi:MAG: alanyl-tRNA editing protein [Candidatus Thorarchaeota archaeon]|jgi:Ser-tRNA(Ala) deacylase AlaX
MTDLLYMKDNYIKEFEAEITALTEDSIVLDRTAFYPEGGGQIGDSGSIRTSSDQVVVVGAKKRDGQVHHIFKGECNLQHGELATGILDWSQRYECMRFHTAQHILSRYLQIHYDLETVGNNISPGKSRADYSPLESFDEEMKKEVQNGVNEILAQNLDVELTFMPREDAISFLKEKGYQFRYLEMVPKSVMEFRIISISDYDAASCAGTHVKNTGEIGEIRIGKTKNVGAGKRRIYFSLVAPS